MHSGCEAKVPKLRSDYQQQEWVAIGRVLLQGFKECGFIPIQLALPFLEEAIYGKSTSSLSAAFLEYVSSSQSAILKKALDDIDAVDSDELLDVLRAYRCRHFPKKPGDIEALVTRIGHGELIQAPWYIIECWRPILCTMAVDVPQADLARRIKELQNQH